MASTTQNPLPAFLICGGEVRNAEGQELGRIIDVITDPRTARVLYAVLSFAGSLEIRGKLFPVPLEALVLNCAGD